MSCPYTTQNQGFSMIWKKVYRKMTDKFQNVIIWTIPSKKVNFASGCMQPYLKLTK
jgi:hypothetical protein